MINEPLSDLNFIEGEVLLFDKPYRWTSFDLVRKVRSVIRKHLGKQKIKVGHAGTLDPLATGLMIICTGRMTKQIEKFQTAEKEYIAELFIGATTPSFDLETGVDNHFETLHIDDVLITKVLEGFLGQQEQIPPSYSAKWVDGQRAYKKAHKGIEVEMKPALVTVHEIEFLSYNNSILTIRVNCSKGTYIRSLARDIGLALNSGAYLANLRRTRTGDFFVEKSMKIEDFILKENLAPIAS